MNQTRLAGAEAGTLAPIDATATANASADAETAHAELAQTVGTEDSPPVNGAARSMDEDGAGGEGDDDDDDDDEEEDEIEKLLAFSSQIDALAPLGKGDAERMYPSDPAAAYRDDLEWRVML